MAIDSDQSLEEGESTLGHAKRRIKPPSIGLRVSERRLLLGLVDYVLILLALLTSLALRTDLPVGPQLLVNAWKWPLTLALTWFIFASIFDIYDLARSASTYHSVRDGGIVAAITSLVYLALPWLTPSLENRTQGFLFFSLSVLFIILWRYLYVRIFTQPTFQRRAVILGTEPAGRVLVENLRSEYAQSDANPFRGTGHLVLGYITTPPDDRKDEMLDDLPILGQGSDLVPLVRRLEVDEVILALSVESLRKDDIREAILDCFELGIPLTGVATIFERLTGRLPIEYVGWDFEAVMSFEDKSFHRLFRAYKRLVDLIITIPGFLILCVMMPFVAVGNLLASRGPLFYKQERLGAGGRPFQIIKFRTMIPDAEGKAGAKWASLDDERVTLVGRWLRKLHLDELPQVFNVFRGEMSIVGPRPERGEFVALLSKKIPYYRARHTIRPGITGWAQIHQDYGSSIEDSKLKLEYDLYYIKNIGFWLDTLILLRTITKVFGFKGR